MLKLNDVLLLQIDGSIIWLKRRAFDGNSYDSVAGIYFTRKLGKAPIFSHYITSNNIKFSVVNNFILLAMYG